MLAGGYWGFSTSYLPTINDLLSNVYGKKIKYNIISKPFHQNELSENEDKIIITNVISFGNK